MLWNRLGIRSNLHLSKQCFKMQCNVMLRYELLRQLDSCGNLHNSSAVALENRGKNMCMKQWSWKTIIIFMHPSYKLKNEWGFCFHFKFLFYFLLKMIYLPKSEKADGIQKRSQTKMQKKKILQWSITHSYKNKLQNKTSSLNSDVKYNY